MSSSWQNWPKRIVSLVSAGKGRLRKHKRNRGNLPGRSPERLQLEHLERRDLLSGTWTALTNLAPTSAGISTMMLLSDGTIMAQGGGDNSTVNTWFSLTPNSSGSYLNGTWSDRRSMSTPRRFYGSNVLTSGSVFLVGGEYTDAGKVFTNTGETYNPVSNTWSAIANFPNTQFGDDPTALLPNGDVLAGYLNGPQTYIYHPSTNTWTATTGTKLRNDNSDEETWVTLPDGSILSYDVCTNDPTGCSRGRAQRYVPSSGTWIDAGAVPVTLTSQALGYELGPALLLPDGRVFQIGANNQTAFYTPSTNSWTAGPSLPSNMGADDAPAAMLPNGHVLLAADTSSPNLFTPPTKIYDFDPVANTITQVTTPTALTTALNAIPAFFSRMVMLPSGQMLIAAGTNQLWVYTPAEAPNSSWLPAITSITRTSVPGTVTLTGTQLNGLSEGASYGDDAEMSSNYPLVQLHNIPFFGSPYLRTFNWSSTGVATGSTPVSVQFALGTGIDVLMSVVANGISSSTALAIEMSPSVNNILLRVDPSNTADLEILNNGSFFDDVPFSSFDRVMVTADSSADTLTVDYRFGNPIPFGGLNYHAGAGIDTLNVNDQTTTSNQTWSLGANSVFRSGSSTITYSDGINFVNVNGGAGANTYNVNGTEFGFTTTLNTGTGADTINVESVNRGNFNIIENGSGNDTVNVSGAARNLNNLPGLLAVSGNGGTDALIVNDQNNATAQTYSVSDTAIGRVGIPGSIFYGRMNVVTLNGGNGADTYVITNTGALNLTTVNTGTGNDTVNVEAVTRALTINEQGSGNDTVNVSPSARNLNDIQNVLAITGNSGTNTLTVNDQNNATAQTYSVSDTAIGRVGIPGSIFYGRMNVVTLNGGNGADTYVITNTGALNHTTVNTGTGNDTVNVEATMLALALIINEQGPGNDTVNVSPSARNLNNIQGTLTVAGNNGTDTLIVNDQGTSTGQTYTITSNSLARSGAATINWTGVNNLTVNGGSGGNTITVGNPSAGPEVDLNPGGGTAGSLTKSNNGLLVLTGVNNYTGATVINGGTLRVGSNKAVPSTSAVTVAAGARFDLNNFNDIIGSLAGPAGSSVSLGTADLTTGVNNTSTTFSGVISGPGRLFKNGTGTFTLGGVNTYTGGTFIRAGGPLQVGVNNAVPAAGGMGLIEAGAQFDLNGHTDTLGSLSGPAGSSVSLGNGALTSGADNTSTTFSGVISGAGGFTKAGTGIFTLAGANTYTGATAVTTGTLLVNGSLAPASTVTVAASAFLGGLGTVGPLTVSGTVSPGATSPGVLSSGAAAFAAGSVFQVRLNGTAAFDRLAAAGAVNLSGLPTLTVALGFASSVGDTFPIVTSTAGITGNFKDHLDGDIFPIGSARFRINYTTNSVVLTHIAAAADHFLVSAPGSSTAGAPFDVTITALDPQNNIDDAYTGTITFTSADPFGASLPPNYTFQPTDQGSVTFAAGATLFTAGTWDVTVTDTASSITGAANVNVQAAPAVAFQVVAPTSATSGTAFDVTVIAVDPYGNTDTNYNGTVTFTSSDTDPGVVLPADYSFAPADSGVHTFSNTGLGETTLITLGDQTLTTTDTGSGIAGSATVTVTAGASGPRTKSQRRLNARDQESLAPTTFFGSVEGAQPLVPTRQSVLAPGGEATPRTFDVAAVDRLFATAPDGPRSAVSRWQPAAWQAVPHGPVDGPLQDLALVDELFH
jgi:autotransporter-associated beta strand protein